MDRFKLQESQKRIKAVTFLGIIVNVVLAVIKMSVGLLAGSPALAADGIHSLSDIVTDLAVLFGTHLSLKEPDEKHPYGHGRMETFSAFFVSLILCTVGALMVYYAIMSIAKGQKVAFSVAASIVAISSVILKEWLYRITKKVAKEIKSSALYANAWHHRSDAFSSVAVLIGYMALKFGFEYGDQFAAIGVGLMVIAAGAKVLGKCFREFAESSADAQTLKKIQKIVSDNTDVKQWHKLRTRIVGRELFVDLHILVDPALNIMTGHEIAEKIEEDIHQNLTVPVNVIVHVEPDIAEMRQM